MKVSYKILKQYLQYIENSDKVAQDLIMHTADIEKIYSQKKDFENIVIWKIIFIEKHKNADNLSVCQVSVWNENLQIVCWGSNLKINQFVAVAKVWSSVLWHWEWEKIIIKNTIIRWIESFWMICSAKEIWLEKEFPVKDDKEILDLSFLNVSVWTDLAKALEKDDEILEIDNKAINHRPDMFSYMWILREIATINWKDFWIKYKNMDFSNIPLLKIVTNEIPNVVKRYSLLKISNVWNKKSRNEIKIIIEAAWHSTKWLLIDVSNYSLYFYWQPAHIFDADKIEGNITIRFAKLWEILEALDDKIYKLNEKDIVIADDKKILALGWIIWWKTSAVSDNTKNILIETAHFDQAILRITWKRLWIRTDSLNIFEKDIPTDLASYATALIVEELKHEYPNLSIDAYFDSYNIKQKEVRQIFDLSFYNNLIWANYEEKYVINILNNLWIKKVWNELIIPFWRKELTTKADIAEEIARIDGYDKIITTIPRVNLWAIVQDSIYYLKYDSRKYFTDNWFFDIYNYSFVNEKLMSKLNLDINSCVALKNFLSEDATHMRNSLIPNLMKWLEDNIRERKNIKLFEMEKVFYYNKSEVSEDYKLSWVMTSSKDIVYYDIQMILSDFLKTVFVNNFFFEIADKYPAYSHAWRIAKIIVNDNEVWYIWEINPLIAKRFDIIDRIWFFEIEVSKLLPNLYSKIKAKELSIFQENNFDLSFVVNKNIKWIEIIKTIIETNKNLIQKVELFDIYENEEKLPWKRSLSFRIYIQSMTETLKDEIKWNLIKEIVEKVWKKWWSLR